ncbi:MAG: cytidine deaminase [Opitutales bacterium]
MPENTKEYPEDWKRVWQAAVQVRERAHARYSGFRVGAALKLTNKNALFVGCNVENASYGATMCAERNAIFQLVATCGGVREEAYLILVTDTKEPTVPCALCLQVLAEFFYPHLPIFLANLEGIQERVTLGDLLPRPFTNFEPES